MGLNKGNWLSKYQSDVQSQNGEDGILSKIFEILGVTQGWCVELGAWDGKKYSNTYHLINDKKWSGVLIEGDQRRFLDLQKTYSSNNRVHSVREYVGFDVPINLDSLLQKQPIPRDFDLISIDIDGNDIHLWESLKVYKPKVVIIEYNPTIPNHIDFSQPKDMKLNQGNSLLALVKLGKEKGYELIATTETNGIFVRKELYPLFAIENNHIDLMRDKSSKETALFQLYDGTVVINGNKKMMWSGLPMKEDRFQVFPRFLRYYTTSNPLKKGLRQIWRFLYTRNIVS